MRECIRLRVVAGRRRFRNGGGRSHDRRRRGIAPWVLRVVPSSATPTDDLASLPTEPTFALDRVGLAPAGGLNLDRRCTTVPAESTCFLSDAGSLQPAPWADGPDGADVTGNVLLATIDDFFPALREDSVQNAIDHGFGSFVVRVRAWNGTANDSAVGLVVYASRGLQARDGGGIERRGPAPADANETWTFVQKAAGTGYVSNHRFVVAFLEPVPFVLPTQIAPAQPPEAGLPLDEDAGIRGNDDERPLTLLLHEAYVLFDLVPQDGGTYRIENGVLAGRVPLDDFFGEASGIRNVGIDEGSRAFCVDGQRTVNLIHSSLCAASDILASRSAEPSGAATTRCDAVSASISFAARPALVGNEIAPSPSDDPCPDYPSKVICGQDAGSVLMP